MDFNEFKNLEKPISSEEFISLEPSTTKEHLMVLGLGLAGVLKRQERVEEILNKDGLVKRVTQLETTWKVGGALILLSLLGLAIRVIFG